VKSIKPPDYGFVCKYLLGIHPINLPKKYSSPQAKLGAQALDLIDQSNDGMDGQPVHPMLVAQHFNMPHAKDGLFIEKPFFAIAGNGTNHPFAAIKNNLAQRGTC
jgi:hypothetical protein